MNSKFPFVVDNGNPTFYDKESNIAFQHFGRPACPKCRTDIETFDSSHGSITVENAKRLAKYSEGGPYEGGLKPLVLTIKFNWHFHWECTYTNNYDYDFFGCNGSFTNGESIGNTPKEMEINIPLGIGMPFRCFSLPQGSEITLAGLSEENSEQITVSVNKHITNKGTYTGCPPNNPNYTSYDNSADSQTSIHFFRPSGSAIYAALCLRNTSGFPFDGDLKFGYSQQITFTGNDISNCSLVLHTGSIPYTSPPTCPEGYTTEAGAAGIIFGVPINYILCFKDKIIGCSTPGGENTLSGWEITILEA